MLEDKIIINAEGRNQELRQNPPQIMNAKEMAIYLGISERKARADAAEGIMPSVRLGGRVLFRLKDIDACLIRMTKGGGA
tara:strand:- start:2254 stop:2493 length:240 start_codon:yes stop_codon:yes gene_type:complete